MRRCLLGQPGPIQSSSVISGEVRSAQVIPGGQKSGKSRGAEAKADLRYLLHEVGEVSLNASPPGAAVAASRSRWNTASVSSGVELPVGTVTFLFTDIEGSTLLLKQLRDRYAGALEDHQRIMRDAFGEHGGHEIDTQGDSFFVAFRRAKEAVATAVACQRRLAAHAWPDDADLRV